MHKKFLNTAALAGGLAVMFGAFAAHALKQKLTADSLLVFETAVRYQFYHVFALLAAGILYKEFPGKFIRWAGWLFIWGMILFCGSLYLLCYVRYNQVSANWIGAITPFGGAAFMAGWIMLAAGIVKKH